MSRYKAFKNVEYSWDIVDSKVLEAMVGDTFNEVRKVCEDSITFENDEVEITFYHNQDCCESVYIEDICGSLIDLQGTPLIVSEETNGEIPDTGESYDSVTWTFYRFRTIKGDVTCAMPARFRCCW